MKIIFGVLSAVSLAGLRAGGVHTIFGVRSRCRQYKTILFIASILYFVFATLWATRRNPAHSSKNGYIGAPSLDSCVMMRKYAAGT